MDQALVTARRGERGLSLIEIMVVVAIIGVLIVALYGQYTHAQAQANAAAVKQELQQISTELEEYHTDCGDYPGGTTGTAPCDGSTGDTNADIALFGGAGNPYMTATPSFDQQEFTYSYVAATGTTSSSYEICSPYVIDSTVVSTLPTGTGNGTGTAGVGICYSPSQGYFAT
jgi:prepilin-type N-terminal cleavage/methylation domain-containing protein